MDSQYASLAISSSREYNQDQELRSPGTIGELLNELEAEIDKLVPWICQYKLKVLLGRIAIKVQKDRPTIGKDHHHMYCYVVINMNRNNAFK